MRMMLKAVVDTEAGTEAIRNGSIAKVIGQMMEQLKPEAAYFTASEDGQRACIVVFDMADPSQLPPISEPLFQIGKARVTMAPCMNLEDLQKGLAELPADLAPTRG